MDNENTFAKKQLELEAIVQKLETGNVPLEEMVSLYEKGAALYRECVETLEQYEKRLEEASGESF